MVQGYKKQQQQKSKKQSKTEGIAINLKKKQNGMKNRMRGLLLKQITSGMLLFMHNSMVSLLWGVSSCILHEVFCCQAKKHIEQSSDTVYYTAVICGFLWFQIYCGYLHTELIQCVLLRLDCKLLILIAVCARTCVSIYISITAVLHCS